MLDIKLVHTIDMNCYDTALATIASYWNRRYEMIHVDKWNFDFVSENKDFPGIIGYRIFPGQYDLYNNFNKYHGIKVIIDSFMYVEDVVVTVKDELSKGYPVALKIDQFFLPWAIEREKTVNRLKGFILIIGANDLGFYCLDLHGSKRMEYLPLDNFLQGCFQNMVMRFSIVGEEVKKINWRVFIKNIVESLYTPRTAASNAFDAMRECAYHMEKSLDFSLEINERWTIDTTPLIRNIKKICRARSLFLMTLKFVGELCNCYDFFRKPMNLFEKATIPWHVVMGLLTKAYFASHFNERLKQVIVSKILEAADLEEQAAKLFIEASKNSGKIYLKKNLGFNEKGPDDKFKEIIFVEIRKYFNNKGFSNSLSNNDKANLTGRGDFFLTEGLPQDNIINIREMKFNLAIIGDGNDNISCLLQRIQVPYGLYKSIFLLGCSEWGNFTEKLRFQFADGTFQELLMDFSDCFYVKEGELVAWEGVRLEEPNSPVKKKGYLYAKRYDLNSKCEMTEIHLPECPNIHIFAISLAR